MLKQQLVEQQLEALTLSNGSMIPILAYSQTESIMSAEQLQKLQKKAIHYFGEQGLIRVTKDKLIIDDTLLHLIEQGKTNEQFYILEHFEQQNVIRQLCFYPEYVGVEKMEDHVSIFHTDVLEEMAHFILEGNKQLNSFSQPVELVLEKSLYLDWMKAISSKNNEKALRILAELQVDEEIAKKLVHIFMTKESFVTLSSYKQRELYAKVMFMIADDYPIVIQFTEQPEIRLEITSVTYEELAQYMYDFIDFVNDSGDE